MRAGKLRNTASFYEPSSGTNAFGEVNAFHTMIGTYKCAVTTVPKTEYEEAGAMVSKTQYDLRFRYYQALDQFNRSGYIMLDGRKLQVKSISNVMLRNREIQMICEELT